jgi:lipopolysaccharide/colanic/teichoic acid biosynthesis glycosyltransferase
MSIGKRLLDVTVAGGLLILAAPVWLVAACGIWMTSPGPIFYRARRVGRDRRALPSKGRGMIDGSDRRRQDGYVGREFTMYKFRTMRVAANDAGAGAPITGVNDARVFPFGEFLRVTKIDELPQLVNVLKGEMTLVGPRPEAPEIVRRHYSPDDLSTLQVTPGVTSPGTIHYYSHCERMLATNEVVDFYVERLLPVKLALDRVYIKNASVSYDIRLILRTMTVICGRVLGVQAFPDPPELTQAEVNGLRVSTAPMPGRTRPESDHGNLSRDRIL